MYNVGNLSPNTTHLHSIAMYIVIFLTSPDLIEIQDDDSPINSRTVSVNETLTALADAIYEGKVTRMKQREIKLFKPTNLSHICIHV